MNKYYVEVKHSVTNNIVSLYVYAYEPKNIANMIDGTIITVKEIVQWLLYMTWVSCQKKLDKRY